MRKRMKQTIARLLVIVMVVAMMPVSGYGATSSTDKFKIGEEGYETWSEVEMKLKDGDIVEVLQNPGGITINVGELDFTLDLKGYTMETTIKINPNGPINVTSAGHVTIKNGIIRTALETDTIDITQAECVTFEDVTIKNTGGQYAIDLAGGAVEFITAEVSTTGTKALNKASGTTVKWGKQTAAPEGWSTAASFTAAITTDYEATLDGVGYARANDALKDVQNGSVVTLLKDVSSQTVDAEGKTFTFDLNNHTISDDLLVKAVGELTVKNGSVVGNQSYSFFWIDTGTVYLENVNVDQLDWGNREAPIYNKGTLHIYSGEFRILDSDGEPIENDPSSPAIITASGGVTTVDTGSYTAPADWETASCFKATYAPVAEVRDSASATTGTKYATLRSALENGVGKHVYLLDNFTLEQAYGIEESLTLNLNGFTLTVDNHQSFPIFDTATVKNGTLLLKSGTYINLQISDGETVLFEDLTVNSESFGLAEVPAGTLVLGKGDYSVSEEADFTFNVYNTGTLEIKEGCATDVAESQWGTVKQMHVGSSIETGDYMISNLEESYIYEGEPVVPRIAVRNVKKNANLASQNYTVVLSDNNKLGKAKITVIGRNAMGGKLEKTFNLLPCAVDSVSVTPAVTGPDNALTVSWTHPQAEQVSVYKVELYDGYDKLKEITTSGTQVTFGDLNRNKEYKFVITPAVNIDNATVYGQTTDPAFGTTDKTDLLTGKTITLEQTSYTYDGTAKEPAVSVDGVDAATYTVSYTKNVNAGTATVTVTGIGDYKGSLTANFTIEPASISNKTATLSYTSTTYNGSAKKPAVTISGLTKDTDYTVAYKNNTNAGTATVTITGKGNYTGTITKTFTIEPASISNKTASLSYSSTTYNGSAKKPAVTISGLTKDTDYTVAYKNNTNAGTATVTITGKGNYTGTITKTFTINKASMSGIKATGKTVTYNGKAHTITISGVPSGAKVYYKTSSSGSYTTTKPIRTSAGTTTVYYKVSKANYKDITGSAKIVVNKRSISKATLSKTTYVYTGKAFKPTVTVKNSSGTKLTKNTHYTVSYKNNTKVGKATVTITGKGNYKGTIKKTFKINPKPTKITSLTKGKKSFTVKWSKKTTQTTGYQIYYTTSTTRKNGKTVTISKNTTTKKTISKLKSKKKYYVWVRTYKTVDGTKYYSEWSARKAVTTK